MKVLLTGATGLLGSHVAHQLHARGYALRIFTRPGSNTETLAGLPFEWIKGSLLDKNTLQLAVEGCDAVIHAAANTAQWPTGLAHYWADNVQATINLLEAARQAGARRFVYVSTANTIGHGSLARPGVEWNDFRLYHYNSAYINSKYLAEKYVLEQFQKHGFPAVVVNPTFMLGGLDARLSSGRLILHALQSQVHWAPPGGKNFIHVRDAAFGVCAALEKGRVGERYLLAGENMTYARFFALLGAVVEEHKLQIPLPQWLILAAGWVGQLWGRLSGRTALMNRATSRLMCLGNYYSGQKAREELGLPQTAVSEAVKDALHWFEAQGMIGSNVVKSRGD